MDPKHFPRSPLGLLPKGKVQPKVDWKVMEQQALAWTVNVGGTVQSR